jgi:hypothetical protein
MLFNLTHKDSNHHLEVLGHRDLGEVLETEVQVDLHSQHQLMVAVVVVVAVPVLQAVMV